MKLYNKHLLTTTRMAKRAKRAMRRLKCNAHLVRSSGNRVVLVPHDFYWFATQTIDISSPTSEVFHFNSLPGQAYPHTPEA